MAVKHLVLVVLLAMQSIAKDPQLIYVHPDGEPKHDPDAIVYTKYCPYDRQLLSCWLVTEYRRDDPSPSYRDYEGYEHFHDITSLKQYWLCECGHYWLEESTNGACWCGWEPW